MRVSHHGSLGDDRSSEIYLSSGRTEIIFGPPRFLDHYHAVHEVVSASIFLQECSQECARTSLLCECALHSDCDQNLSTRSKSGEAPTPAIYGLPSAAETRAHTLNPPPYQASISDTKFLLGKAFSLPRCLGDSLQRCGVSSLLFSGICFVHNGPRCFMQADWLGDGRDGRCGTQRPRPSDFRSPSQSAPTCRQ